MKALAAVGIVLFILGAEASAEHATILTATMFITGTCIMKFCSDYFTKGW